MKNTISKYEELSKEKTLWIIITGVFCLNFVEFLKECEFCSVPTFTIQDDFEFMTDDEIMESILNAKTLLEKEIKLILPKSSAVLILPPLPTALMHFVNPTDRHFHNMHKRDLNTVVCDPRLFKKFRLFYKSLIIKFWQSTDLIKVNSSCFNTYSEHINVSTNVQIIRSLILKVKVDSSNWTELLNEILFEKLKIDKTNLKLISPTPNKKQESASTSIPIVEPSLLEEISDEEKECKNNFSKIYVVGKNIIKKDIHLDGIKILNFCFTSFPEKMVEDFFSKIDKNPKNSLFIFVTEPSNFSEVIIQGTRCVNAKCYKSLTLSKIGDTFEIENDNSEDCIKKQLDIFSKFYSLVIKRLDPCSAIIFAPIRPTIAVHVKKDLFSHYDLHFLNDRFKNVMLLHGTSKAWDTFFKQFKIEWKKFEIRILKEQDIFSSRFHEKFYASHEFRKHFTSIDQIRKNLPTIEKDWKSTLNDFIKQSSRLLKSVNQGKIFFVILGY